MGFQRIKFVTDEAYQGRLQPFDDQIYADTVKMVMQKDGKLFHWSKHETLPDDDTWAYKDFIGWVLCLIGYFSAKREKDRIRWNFPISQHTNREIWLWIYSSLHSAGKKRLGYIVHWKAKLLVSILELPALQNSLITSKRPIGMEFLVTICSYYGSQRSKHPLTTLTWTQQTAQIWGKAVIDVCVNEADYRACLAM